MCGVLWTENKQIRGEAAISTPIIVGNVDIAASPLLLNTCYKQKILLLHVRMNLEIKGCYDVGMIQPAIHYVPNRCVNDYL